MKNYDKKVKQTRILLSDYLLLKSFAQNAGVSMSEALHMIIVARAEARPHEILTPVELIKVPVIAVRSTPVITARRGSTPITASFSREVETNGHR